MLDLCVGTSRCKLPGSPEESLLLKEKGLYALEEWQRLFGEHYPEIRLAYLHLKEVVGASFPDAQVRCPTPSPRGGQNRDGRASCACMSYRD